VIGSLEGKDERTVQYEGRADEPTGAERARLTELYLGVFPMAVSARCGLVSPTSEQRPTWLRYSDYNVDPPEIVELDDAALRELR